MPRPMWIDTDTASDDAVALVIALTHPEVEVVGITVVAGNVPLELGVQNALWVVEQCGSTVPVHAGAAVPLVVPLETGQYVHGQDGMGDIGLPLNGRTPAGDDAVGALLDASHRYPGTLELVTLGPLTNLALALRTDPTLPERISRCVVMGAVADHVGNQTPVAEFNMWVDPHAVDEVLRSGLALEFVGWDISRRFAVFDPEAAADLGAIGTVNARWTVEIQRCLIEFCHTQTGLPGFDLPDPIAIAYAIDGRVATETRRLACWCETESELTRGMVVIDLLGLTTAEPNALFVLEADRDHFVGMLRAALAADPRPAGPDAGS